MLNSDDSFISDDLVSEIAETFNCYSVDGVCGKMIYKNRRGVFAKTWKSRLFEPDLFEKS